MKTFWSNLKKPFFTLAPLDDVSDTVFREVVIRAAAPDVVFTEFANTDGFVHPEGAVSVQRKLRVNDSERALGVPLIAQIWGSTPDHYHKTTLELVKTGLYAGIDINMGCPEKGIVRRGCCGGLIKYENRENASNIIKAVQAAAGVLPVSVKTRLGFGAIDTETWVSFLLEHQLDALTIHGRTVREMSKVPAHWDEIGKVAKLRNKIAPRTVLIGNGDIESKAQGDALSKKYGLDGLMVGRGVFHNLFVFADEQMEHKPYEMFTILLKHVELYDQTWGESEIV